MFYSKMINVPDHSSSDMTPRIIRRALTGVRKENRVRPLPCERYEYRALQTTTSFRLLKVEREQGDDCIFCTLEDAKLDDTPVYNALSYVWGQPDFSERIYCDKGYIDVTANAFAAVRQLRRKDRKIYIWIDAICIDSLTLDYGELTAAAVYTCYLHYLSTCNSPRTA